MREIKFRAWDLSEQEMLGWDTVQNQYFYTIEQYPDYSIMQYTGIKDANKKEIYERDLLKDDENFIWEVSFSQGSFVIRCDDLMVETILYQLVWNKDIERLEVVGNKYENFELIQGN